MKEVEHFLPVPGELSQKGGENDLPVEGMNQGKDKIPKGGHILGSVTGPDRGAVFSQDDILFPVQEVEKLPGRGFPGGRLVISETTSMVVRPVVTFRTIRVILKVWTTRGKSPVVGASDRRGGFSSLSAYAQLRLRWIPLMHLMKRRRILFDSTEAFRDSPANGRLDSCSPYMVAPTSESLLSEG